MMQEQLDESMVQGPEPGVATSSLGDFPGLFSALGLVIQWLVHGAFTACCPGSILGQGTKTLQAPSSVGYTGSHQGFR